MQSRRTFIIVGTAVGAALVTALTLTVIWLIGSYRDRQDEFAERPARLKEEAWFCSRQILRTAWTSFRNFWPISQSRRLPP